MITTSKDWIGIAKKVAFIYPIVFVVVLFAIGVNDYGDDVVVLMPDLVPLSAPIIEPTPVPTTTINAGGTKYTLVYEKGNNKYLVYDGFRYIGFIDMESVDSIDNVSEDNLLSLVDITQ